MKTPSTDYAAHVSTGPNLIYICLCINFEHPHPHTFVYIWVSLVTLCYLALVQVDNVSTESTLSQGGLDLTCPH